MKNLYLLLLIFIIFGCNKVEKEQEYVEIKIKEHYPYESNILDNIDQNTLELFNYKIFALNSLIQLIENPLYNYCSEDLKKELSKCDFKQNTLIITGFSNENVAISIDSSFGYNNFYSEYLYKQTVSCKVPVEPAKKTYLIIDAFLVKKIPTDSKLTCGRIVGFSKSK